MTLPSRPGYAPVRRALRLLPLLALVSACSQPPTAPGPLPAARPDGVQPAPVADGAAWIVDPAASLIAVTVRRGGLLARLGHDHVIAVHTLAGQVAPALDRADLSFRLDAMTVDEPQLLREAGIESQPAAAAIEGTRHNMLGPVLDAPRFPLVALHVERAGADRLRVDVTLHGVTRRLLLPAVVRVGSAEVDASGTARLNQTDFGITPFSVGGGLLAVEDALEIRYRIVARRGRGAD